jgi:hypothetical protein
LNKKQGNIGANLSLGKLVQLVILLLLPPSEHHDIGEEHKNMAKQKRKQSSQPKIYDVFSTELKHRQLEY